MNSVPGVDMSTGSLGQGVSCAAGMALAARKKGMGCNVYTLLGDGEIEEGEVWEALMFASHYKLDYLCVIIDNNGLQIDGPIDEVMSSYPIVDKLVAFIQENKIEEIVLGHPKNMDGTVGPRAEKC